MYVFYCSSKIRIRLAQRLKNSRRSLKRPALKRPNPSIGRRRLIGPQIVFYQWTKALTAPAILLVLLPCHPKIDFCPQTISAHLRLQPCLPKGQVRISINALAFPPSVLTVRSPIASPMEVWRSESKVSWIKQPPTHQEAVRPNCTYLQSSL